MYHGGLVMRFNFELMKAIKEKGLTQKSFAGLVGENEAKVSLVINGRLNLTDREKLKYASVLQMNVEDLFVSKNKAIFEAKGRDLAQRIFELIQVS
jgi:plasmid maintenance system antidote protein VapI